ncbi:hypothetical protein ACFSTD_18185 [Novosphingobium colocasiae]
MNIILNPEYFFGFDDVTRARMGGKANFFKPKNPGWCPPLGGIPQHAR